MPKEYEHCVETEKKKHPLKDAKRICAIMYWKRHGVSVNEAHKRMKKKSVKSMQNVVKVARTKKALVELAREVVKSFGGDVNDYIILPLTEELRNHPKLKALAPKVEDEDMKYVLIKKSYGGEPVVEVTLEGKLKLNLDNLPENSYAEELNTPERADIAQDTVNTKKEVSKSVQAEEEKGKVETKCKGEGCEDKKVEQKDFEPERMEKMPEVVEGGVLKSKLLDMLQDKLSEEELTQVKSMIEGLLAAKSLMAEDAPVVPEEEEEIVKSGAAKEEKEDKKEEKDSDKSARDALGEVMAKVAKGEKLTELERAMVSAAVDAVKKETNKGDKEAKDVLGKVMSKVARGEKLADEERKILAAAVDASKKAKSEVTKSVTEALKHMKEEVNEDFVVRIYKSMSRFGPVKSGDYYVFGFVSKSEAQTFVNRVNSNRDALDGRVAYVRTPSIVERRKLPASVKFVVDFE